ncbi:PREDICTED: probable carboxypeptidase PM20D1 [Priapulus caudatus]|uniref:Probable carboxypeptidase PM20D1 n=1 Tax=Priapulus caudatus TaxID=37621 RepID=A0ABM1ESC2_PRICU|nr:PREDICTED: probable carboxypeptidase PM20D1 [Priapulus caudatus]
MAASIVNSLVKITALISAFLLLFVTLLVVRTLLLAPPTAHVTKCDPKDADFIKADARALRIFSRALTIKTISWSADKISGEALLELHRHVFESYPLIHSSPYVQLELVNNYSLLYTVSGSDPELQPYMLAAHLDVVPEGRLEDWEVPPFAGVVDDKHIWGRGAIDDKHSMMPFPVRVIVSNLWLFSPLIDRLAVYNRNANALIRTTTAVTMCHGGHKSNVVPSAAWAVVNHRLHPAHTIAQVLELDRAIIDDPRVEVKVIAGNEPHPVSPAGGATFGYQTIRRSIQEVFDGMTVAPGLFIAASDTRWYLNLTDQIYRFTPVHNRPEDISRYHGNNERIGIRNYEQTINFYYHVIVNSDLAEVAPPHVHGEEL